MKKLLVYLLVVVMLACCAGCDSDTYEAAMAEFNKGNYVKASELFSQIYNYENAQEMDNKSQYLSAVDEYYSSNYIEAMNAFADLEDFEDANEKVSEIFKIAFKNYISGSLSHSDFLAILEEFAEKVENTDESILTAKYYIANDYFKSGDYSSACQYFYDTKGYENTEQLYNESKYILAIDNANKGDLIYALNGFTILGDSEYKNSRTYAQQIRETVLCNLYEVDTDTNGDNINDVRTFLAITKTTSGPLNIQAISQSISTGEIVASSKYAAICAYDGTVIVTNSGASSTCDERFDQNDEIYSLTFNGGPLETMGTFKSTGTIIPEYTISYSSDISYDKTFVDKTIEEYSNLSEKLILPESLSKLYNK